MNAYRHATFLQSRTRPFRGPRSRVKLGGARGPVVPFAASNSDDDRWIIRGYWH